MADELEQARLRVQRDAALEAADEAGTERDLVIGAAAGAARERDRTQAERDRLAVERVALQGQRSAAWQYAATEQQEARGSAVGFYTLLAIVTLVLLVLAGCTSRAARTRTPP